MPNTSTRIILKKPKTDSSIRKVWLPKTLAYILREWKKSQDELKGFLGDEYQDFDLVVALPNGRPCEDRIILKEFAKLREDAGLPKVVFHSLRHSSTTYKLKLNHGDLKATQGDTGHAEIDMIQNGDYLIPDLKLSQQPEKHLGKYGRMRKAYLKEHRPILYNQMLLSEKLYQHLLEIDETAQNRLEQMMPQLAKEAGATEELKASDPMKWVGLMNTCKAQAEEILMAELINS